MTRLLEKLFNKLSKIGLAGIECADDNLRSNEDYVRKVIKNKGVHKFYYASDFLKSDAEFILSMVEEFPGILEFCDNKIYDRYMPDCFMMEEIEMDPIIFLDMCYIKNDDCLYYFPDDLVINYLNMIKNGEVIKGCYQGKEYEHKLEIQEGDNLWFMVYEGNF